jgi:ATP-binding cassette subfamily F protein 3
MIQLTSLSKSFGDRVLFDEVTWQISDRECVGLCGPNGAGKTTLLRLLAGLDEPDSGAIVKPAGLRIGFLPQDGLVHSGRTVQGEASLAFQPLLDLKAEMHDLEARLGDPSIPADEHEQMLARYSDVQDRFRIQDGYSMDLRIASVLAGLGFSQVDLDKPTDTLSGGWQMRLALGKLLLARPDLLLLDEPTNHLDLEARNWLESYLASYPYAVILVSHDRFFLDAVVGRITEVNLKTLTDYPGNYSHYLAESQARLERLRDAKRQQDEEVARMRQFIDRFRYQATKAAQVQSRIKMLEKITPIDVPPERKRVRFRFPSSVKSGRLALELRKARKVYGDLVVLKGVDLHIERGERIALVGPNGVGKSTLMRLLAGVEPPDSGARQEGHQVVMQYFAQDEASRLDPALTVYETLAAGSPHHMVPAIRDILGGFLFSGDDVYKPVRVLSGGERTRLAVARMLLRPSNTLLLDEPTNHLDLDSKDVLLDALVDYGGTLVFVSHDRYFIDRLATRIVEIGRGEAHVYPGNYEEFLWHKEHTDAPPATGARRGGRLAPPPVLPAPRERAASARPLSMEARRGARKTAVHADSEREARKRATAEARRLERTLADRRRRIADLEARIAEREQAIKTIEAAMASPGFYENHEAAQGVVGQHQALMWEVGDLMHQWEMLVSMSTEDGGG